MTDTPPLISTAELAASLDEPDLRLVDASWHIDGRDAEADFRDARLPGAVFFDLEASSDPESPLPHMLPSAMWFGGRMGALGLSDRDHIVVYDALGVRSAPRAWWMFKAMGASRVQVLDGGLPRWRAEGRRLEHGPPQPRPPATFAARLAPEAVVTLDEMRDIGGAAQVLDARSAGRFRGQAPEPRPGLRSGHMPGALNLPFERMFAHDGAMKPPAELEAAFVEAGVDLDRPVITTCGSGVTAAVLSLGLAVLGRPSRLYDGSWSEWVARDDTPVVAD